MHLCMLGYHSQAYLSSVEVTTGFTIFFLGYLSLMVKLFQQEG